ncbi:MAG: cellulose biosynthesis protein BcsS [Hyphomicrobiales bacterium]|nr:cellulose biosynthesis protein BcsS [Hyphomicrobiales bacterium]
MRSGRLLLSVVASAFCSPAFATDWYTGAPGSQAPAPPQSSYISFFDQNPEPTWTKSAPVIRVAEPAPKFGVAIDAAVTADTKDSKFFTAIGTIAPFSDFNQSGMRLRIGGVIGTYAYNNTTLGRINGKQEDGSVMIGYEWVTPNASFAIYGGGDFNNNTLDKYDPNNTSVGQASGVKVAVDFNYRPTPYTMLSGVGSYSTAHNAYYARLKAGYAIAPSTYIGPEAIFMGDDFFRQWRLGGHVTGAAFGPLQLGASAGVLVDKVRGTGLYGIIDARVGF